jgi:hypothetical protein
LREKGKKKVSTTICFVFDKKFACFGKFLKRRKLRLFSFPEKLQQNTQTG